MCSYLWMPPRYQLRREVEQTKTTRRMHVRTKVFLVPRHARGGAGGPPTRSECALCPPITVKSRLTTLFVSSDRPRVLVQVSQCTAIREQRPVKLCCSNSVLLEWEGHSLLVDRHDPPPSFHFIHQILSEIPQTTSFINVFSDGCCHTNCCFSCLYRSVVFTECNLPALSF